MAGFNISDKQLDFLRGCVIDFDMKSGLSETLDTEKRYLSQMKGMFSDSAAFESAVQNGNPMVYEFHSLDVGESSGDLAFGCSILNPGKVGDEYYFTKVRKPDFGFIQSVIKPIQRSADAYL